MEKLSSERGSVAIWVSCAILAIEAGFWGGRLLERSAENTDGRVHQVQLYNEQLDQQLSSGRRVGNLILNDAKHSFSFVTASQEGQVEDCSGKYEVKDHAAQTIGKLTCSVTLPASR